VILTARLLVLVFGLAMLAPPGVCLCHLAEIEHQEDEHAPGCPACEGAPRCLAGQPVSAPADAPALCRLCDSPPPVLPPGVARFAEPSPHPPFWGPPIYLTVRALLI
jgi:hypothetical protein